MRERRGAVVFGASDGLTLILGLMLGLALARQPDSSIWHGALAGGLAEFGGMALGQYWSDPARNKVTALCNGLAAAATVIMAGVPFAVMSGVPAVGTAAVVIFCLGLAVTWLREETGWVAALHTFGLLLLAGGLGAASGLL